MRMRIRVRRSQRDPTPHYYPNLKVNHKNRELLEPLVELGKSQISAFMRETKVNFVPVPALNVHIILRTRKGSAHGITTLASNSSAAPAARAATGSQVRMSRY